MLLVTLLTFGFHFLGSAEPRKWNPKVNRVTNNMENLRLAKG